MDRNQKWLLGVTTLSLAASLSVALFLSENKHARRMMDEVMHDIRNKL